jgi:hypothetical protein
LSYLSKQGVARSMPVDIVDPLEVVQVHEEEGKLAFRAIGPGQGLLDPIMEERTVPESGQRIVKCLIEELLFQLPTLGHIVAGHDETPDRRVVDQVDEREFEWDRRVVSMAHEGNRHRDGIGG